MKLKAILLSSLLTLSGSALACECSSCDVDDVRSDLESEQRNREDDIQSLQSDIQSLQSDIESLAATNRRLRSDFDDLESQLNRYSSRY